MHERPHIYTDRGAYNNPEPGSIQLVQGTVLPKVLRQGE